MIVKLLADNPLLLLFVIVALGYPLGRVKIAGGRLGVAAVPFIGIGISALDPALKLPPVIEALGLALFVYAVGISSGALFFASMKYKGLRDNLFVIGMLAFAALFSGICGALLHLRSTLVAGMYAGALTNIPSLAAVLEYMHGTLNGPRIDAILSEPVVGFSIGYPVGLVGMILVVQLAQNRWKIDYGKEARGLKEFGASGGPLENRIVLVTRPEVTQEPVGSLFRRHNWEVVFGRIRRNGQLSVVNGEMTLQIGDIVNVVGPADELDRVIPLLGEASAERIEFDRSEVDYRRVFVSNPQVAGRPLRQLDLLNRFNALITRVRRGDADFVPNGDTVLVPGDRVRVLTDRRHLDEVSRYFGDSYRAVSEFDVLALSLGLALGLLLGALPIPLPGGITLRLGNAGGPLIVGILLGALGRTGPIVWNLPYGVNITLRQFGMVLFLAGIGTRAGASFFTTLSSGGGVLLLIVALAMTCLTGYLTLYIGYRILKIPMAILIGMLAGLQTQPALLGYALEQTENDLPNIGSATVYPAAMITKILLAQLLYTVLK